MIIIIQCAATKSPNAGYFHDKPGVKVAFVAHPDIAPPVPGLNYAKPDDMCREKTYRQRLLDYNESGRNPWSLLPAWQLYQNQVYSRLFETVRSQCLFILSAGWGLIPAEFLTPYYDITFSNSAEKYKKRGKRDEYQDLNLLPPQSEEELVFFGGKDYLPFFDRLTASHPGRRTVYFNSNKRPEIANCSLIQFETRTRTNWHYKCANAFITGNSG